MQGPDVPNLHSAHDNGDVVAVVVADEVADEVADVVAEVVAEVVADEVAVLVGVVVAQACVPSGHSALRLPSSVTDTL